MQWENGERKVKIRRTTPNQGSKSKKRLLGVSAKREARKGRSCKKRGKFGGKKNSGGAKRSRTCGPQPGKKKGSLGLCERARESGEKNQHFQRMNVRNKEEGH